MLTGRELVIILISGVVIIGMTVPLIRTQIGLNSEDIESWVIGTTAIFQVIIGSLVLIVTSIGAYGFLAVRNKNITMYSINSLFPF